MKNRFIVLIDFSEYSDNLIRYVYDWSVHADAELLLVHRTAVITPAHTDIEVREQIKRQTNAEGLRKLKALAKDIIPPTARVSYIVSERQLRFTLNSLLSEPFNNLIFTGISGTGLLKKVFLGSTAIRVINNTKNIVVTMPKEIAVYSHEKIFVAVTEQHPLNLLELNKFLNFIDRENTSITFFYLAAPNEKTNAIEKQLKNLTSTFANKFNTSFAIYKGSNPFEDIKKVINSKIDEILIVQKGSRLLTDQLFRKFLINELVYDGQTPLIVLP
jgi:hypothetical protein